METKDVFISYKSEEFNDALWVKNVLESRGISCWMAPMCITGGASYASEIPAAINNCKAWQNGEVYLQPAYNAYYTNYEIALINTWFAAKTVYPALFEDIDITAKTNEICKKFLGKELANEIFAYHYSYQKLNTATFFQ